MVILAGIRNRVSTSAELQWLVDFCTICTSHMGTPLCEDDVDNYVLREEFRSYTERFIDSSDASTTPECSHRSDRNKQHRKLPQASEDVGSYHAFSK